MRRARQRLLAAPKAGIMDTIAQELRQAARRLTRTPVFTAAAATTLALAIAANAAIFTLVHRVVLNPLPYADSERLLALDYGIPSRNVPSGVQVMTWQLYHQLADNARTLDSIAAYNASGATLTGSGTPERVAVTRATPSLVSVLRVAPALGRWFTETGGHAGARRGRRAGAWLLGSAVRRGSGHRRSHRPASTASPPTSSASCRPRSRSRDRRSICGCRHNRRAHRRRSCSPSRASPACATTRPSQPHARRSRV